MHSNQTTSTVRATGNAAIAWLKTPGRIASFTAALASGLCANLYAQTTPVPGSLDTTFNGTGKITNVNIGADDSAWKTALQADGKIVVLGECVVGANNNFCFARFNTDGSLDTSFVGPNGTGAGKFSLSLSSGSDYGFALAIQSDQKIVAAGGCVGSNEDTCIVRLNTDGSRDTSFGNNGKVSLALSATTDKAYAIAIQSDDKIVVGGPCQNSDAAPKTEFCVARLTTAGDLDLSFGDQPISPGPRTGFRRFAITGHSDSLTALLIQPNDGRIVVVGECQDASGNGQFCAARLRPANGTLDDTFVGPSGAGNGKFTLDVGATGIGYAARLQADGKILITGGCKETLTSYETFCIARLNANGSYDATFVGPLGDGAGRFLLPFGRISDFANDVSVQADGKIVLAGQCDTMIAATRVQLACLARLNVDGTLDFTFDGTPPTVGNGKVFAPLVGVDEKFESMVIQPDGKIVGAGRCKNGAEFDFCLARFHGNNVANQCSLDIDGDGTHTATIDGLIATRTMLGFTNDAAVGSIVFPANAQRKTWTDIRSFLVNQCGMAIAP
ncbi:MAG: hypothetical protein ACRDAM_19845 [Casimicrobium sp.]